MKIDNPTPLDVVMLPMMGPGDSAALTVIAKATYSFSPGKTRLAADHPPAISRRTMLAPIRPRPIIPSCMISPFC